MWQGWFEKSEENICASRSVRKYFTEELIVPRQRICNDNVIVRASRSASLSSDRPSQSLKRKDQIAAIYYSYCIDMNDVMITHDLEKMYMHANAWEHKESKFDFQIIYQSPTLIKLKERKYGRYFIVVFFGSATGCLAITIDPPHL